MSAAHSYIEILFNEDKCVCLAKENTWWEMGIPSDEK